ncbi:MAG: fructose bisphosphate aldolase [Psittacicella sp.]
MFNEQFEKVKLTKGFIAALDQSGGSSANTLALYGLNSDAWSSETEMFTLIHNMRKRIMTAKSFTEEKILGVILFENTLNDTVDGVPTATYLWNQKKIVPFLKIDKGLADKVNDVQMMKDIPGLVETLQAAKAQGVFGTKMRSYILEANAQGIEDVVAQQFEVGDTIIGQGLVPIIEPEINIHSATRKEAEVMLRDSLLAHLNKLPKDKFVMLKLSLPLEAGFYDVLVNHPQVVRVVALSGGYPRVEACEILSENKGIIASYSRALLEGLKAQQTDEEFEKALGDSIDLIYRASI